MIAALYVQRGGSYWGLPDVDPWDEQRDARLYAGPHPVVAHPPCSAWSKLAPINQKRWGRKVGDDNGCFESALRAVRTWGGVLEHPAGSYAWKRFNLTKPSKLGWTQHAHNAWVCEVAQSAYGHKARKLTWLFYHGNCPPFDFNWDKPQGIAWVSNLNIHQDKPRLSKKEASATPTAFRDELLRLARSSK